MVPHSHDFPLVDIILLLEVTIPAFLAFLPVVLVEDVHDGAQIELSLTNELGERVVCLWYSLLVSLSEATLSLTAARLKGFRIEGG